MILLFDPELATTHVSAVIRDLRASLAESNRHVPNNDRLRLRIALHRGEVLIDTHGYSGSALVEASRLSNATGLREQLAATTEDTALIVSDQMWRQLVGSHHEPLDPGAYHPVAISAHGVTTHAWVHVPDHHARSPSIMSPHHSPALVSPVYRSILALDIQGSTEAVRTHPVKGHLRHELYRLLDQAMRTAGIKEQHHDPTSDQGDGVLLLVHPVDDLPKTHLLSSLIPELTAGLAAHNHTVPPAQQVLLRAALHAGEIHHDPNGPFGNSIDVTFRLLGAPKFKAYRRQSSAPLVLIVSGDIYQSVVWHNYPGIDRATYQQLLSIRVADRLHHGWAHTPTGPGG